MRGVHGNVSRRTTVQNKNDSFADAVKVYERSWADPVVEACAAASPVITSVGAFPASSSSGAVASAGAVPVSPVCASAVPKPHNTVIRG